MMQQPPKWMSLDNDIGTFEGFLTPAECQDFINKHKMAEAAGMTIRRSENQSMAHMRQDRTMFMMDSEWVIGQTSPMLGQLLDRFWRAFDEYTTHYSILQEGPPHTILNMRLQKTLPGEGYHIWHCENNARALATRVTAFMIYLNDVEEGGETEFLYRPLRIKPKAGTLIVWPAGFTHTHRGNPPLKGEKYVITGWTDMA